MAQIREAGPRILSWRLIQIRPHFLTRRHRGGMVICPLCREAYPAKDGGICRACQGEALTWRRQERPAQAPALK